MLNSTMRIAVCTEIRSFHRLSKASVTFILMIVWFEIAGLVAPAA